jgi:hypothetical protein
VTVPDYFNEARRALDGVKHEFAAVSSVNATAIYGVPHACELALRGLYSAATGQVFPQDKFKPYHQPEVLAGKLSVTSYYSSQSQSFLKELTGRALSDARYPGSDAHDKYTNATSGTISYYLIEQADKFVEETSQLSKNVDVLNVVRAAAPK